MKINIDGFNSAKHGDGFRCEDTAFNIINEVANLSDDYVPLSKWNLKNTQLSQTMGVRSPIRDLRHYH